MSASRLSPDAYARFFEMVHEGVHLGTLSDTGSTTSAANPYLRLLFGYPADAAAEDVRPFDPARFVDPAARAALLERLRRDGAVSDYLLRLRRADGAPLWIEVTGQAQPGPTPDTLQVDALLRDVSERRKLEEETRDLYQQLLQAEKMAVLGQTISGVAHELNNPLSVIIGYGQLLLSREVPETMRRPVELMVAQGDRMAKIVRNLLFFARQRPPERAAVNLQAVVEQTLALRVNQLTLSGITVETEFAASLPEITGDAQQLEQVFLNLLLNAEQAILEAKPQGRITVRTRASAAGDVLYADVIDDGPGIASDALPRVFEPFFTTKMVGSGTGLGLSVSYGILEEHGGRLTVQSRRGETIFTVELPVSSAPLTPRPGALRPMPPGEGRVALVVEDEPSVLDLIVTLLKERGWAVDVASGGRAGMECVEHRTYDLIVSDMRMPDGDGAQFYRRVRERTPALARHFVFITGDTANEEAWAFLEDARVPVIEKPFPPAVFDDAVARVMTPDSPRA